MKPATTESTHQPEKVLGVAAEANFHVGEDFYQKKEYEEAAKLYAAAKAKGGMSALGEKATYKLGWANFQQKKYDAMVEQMIANGYPPSCIDVILKYAANHLWKD